MAAPSEGTNPSRSASKGRLAFSGSSFRVLRARMTANPANPNWLIPASAPPASTTSANPFRRAVNASPKAWFEAAQAVVAVELYPLAPE